ncbi:hypothetical protein [Paracidovorax oryzae]|uniref:hypothetical protein n=1 Tax=Paracidovorax oryzae TaxID=862720 RepID=UPI0012EB5160|nr:hypothetical protein [Paracidovorax oryzae]
MKPYITDSMKNGKYILPIQYGGRDKDFVGSLSGGHIKAYGLPNKQSLTMAWEFFLSFGNGSVLKFSSACTNVGGWEELGSINLEIYDIESIEDFSDILVWHDIEDFLVKKIGIICYEDAKIYSECGIFFENGKNENLIVCTGISPGSVSVFSSFSFVDFDPEIPIEKCRKIYITSDG